MLALPVTTKRSHVGDGFCVFDVMISTWSPLASFEFNGAMRLLIFAPTHLSPMSE
jgi:hypothetical protein